MLTVLLKFFALALPSPSLMALGKLCSAFVFGGFLGLKFGRRDGEVRNRDWSGISSGLSLATASLNLEIKHLYYSEFKTFFCLYVLKGSCVTSCYRQDSYLYFFCA